MDANFYEFWSQFFSALAKGQRQADELNQWNRLGLEGAEAFSSLFRKVYGLDNPPAGKAAEGNAWEKSAEAFRGSMKDFLALFDVVPRRDYQDLLDECRALREKTAQLEETIAALRKRRGKKAAAPEETVEGLREVIRKQSDEFQSLMKAMANIFQTPPKS